MKSKLGYFLKLEKALYVLPKNCGGGYRNTKETPPFHHHITAHMFKNSLYYQTVI